MENNKEHHIERTNFDAFVHAVGSEIEQAQVRLITPAKLLIVGSNPTRISIWCLRLIG